MSLLVRLAKIGKRDTKIFRVVVMEKRSKRNTSPIEVVGTYEERGTKNKPNPQTKLNGKRIAYWQSVGALLSPAVEKILPQK
jgi:small subunit ribosomal protein S16